MEYTAYFSFIGNLNDFLSVKKKNSSIPYFFNNEPAIKDAIEAIGIPHVEVDRIIVNNISVDFYYKLKPDDYVTVYPAGKNAINTNTLTLIPSYHLHLSFVADVHLGKLVKALRMFGIDVAYTNNYLDEEIVRIAVNEKRIVLTRDIGLLKHKVLSWGYWIRSQKTEEQLQEIFDRYLLETQIDPFTRCLQCNGLIQPVAKENIIEKLPADTIKFFNQFYQCTFCKNVYWKGSHFERMQKLVRKFTAD